MTTPLVTFTTVGTTDVIPIDFGGRGGTFQISITDAGGSPAATAEIRASPDNFGSASTNQGVPGTMAYVSGNQTFLLDTVAGWSYRLWYPTAARTVKIWASPMAI